MARVFLSKHLRPVLKDLPDHYKARYMEAQRRKPISVHFREEEGEFKKIAKTGKVFPMKFFNLPPKMMYPKESDRGLWGGEGIVLGFRQRKDFRPKHPRTWSPTLSRELLYSEILDRWMTIIVTPRTMGLIEDAGSLDSYILKTHEVDLKSRLGMHLKREMLLTLARKSLYPNDPEKREEMYRKYEQYIIPEEEAEWVGLTLLEAVRKQVKKDVEARARATRPLKERFLDDLLEGKEEVAEAVGGAKEEEESKGVLQRLFARKKPNT